ncbi:MAG: NAD(P)/FAD-dependent oxidoreductase, partial [Chloroflexi bacterium]
MTETITARTVDASATETAISRWLADFERALTARDIDAAADLFVEDCYWRDLVAFTWNIITIEGPEGVRKMLAQTLDQVRPSGFRVTDELGEAAAPTESWIRFETSVGGGLGHLRLRDDKAWTLLTTLNDLKGHEEPKRDRRPKGIEHGAVPNRQTWLEQRRLESDELGHVTQPYVVIVGGGQGGIALGARLRQLSVPTIIVDRNPRPGDAWRKRYKSLTLHDPVWYDHLPYIDFPPNWPVFS